MPLQEPKDEISWNYDEQYTDYPTNPSDSDEKPFFLVKVPTLIDPEELEEIPSSSHSDVLNKGILVYILIRYSFWMQNVM